MRKTLLIAAAMLPLAACTTGYGADPLSQIINSIGTLGSAGYGGYGNYGYPAGYGGYNSGYGGSFSQAAVQACAGTASRYGQVSIRNVQQIDASHMKVWGSVYRGYSSDSWDCTFRSDGRISDFDI